MTYSVSGTYLSAYYAENGISLEETFSSYAVAKAYALNCSSDEFLSVEVISPNGTSESIISVTSPYRGTCSRTFPA